MTTTRFTNGSLNSSGKGIRVVLKMLIGELIEMFVRIQFSATNNVIKYEALLMRMHLAQLLGLKGWLHIAIFIGGKLVQW